MAGDTRCAVALPTRASAPGGAALAGPVSFGYLSWPTVGCQVTASDLDLFFISCMDVNGRRLQGVICDEYPEPG